jgi:hypothetical protein
MTLRNSTVEPSPVRLTTQAVADGDRRLDQVAAERSKAGENTIFVCARKPLIAKNARDQNCNEFRGLAHRLKVDEPFLLCGGLEIAYPGTSAAQIE